MKTLIKVVLGVIGLVLIALTVLALVARPRIEEYFRERLVQTLSYIYLTDVTLTEVTIHPFDRSLELEGLRIHNPEGFANEPAMEFGRIRVFMDGSSLLTGTPVINLVELEQSAIHVRHELLSGVNLSVLARRAERLKAVAETADESATTAETQTPPPPGARRKYLIKELSSDIMTIDVSSSVLPVGNHGLDLAPFELHDISPDTPVTIAEMSVIFLRSIVQEKVSLEGLAGPIMDALKNAF